ncbi:MAG: hypothetical protein JWO66_2267, partial [Candidatus Eremiobacteraeota bacterium]|nr:hypothetical protein [Candidatus Eremiobacteraeota bacterium]
MWFGAPDEVNHGQGSESCGMPPVTGARAPRQRPAEWNDSRSPFRRV